MSDLKIKSYGEPEVYLEGTYSKTDLLNLIEYMDQGSNRNQQLAKDLIEQCKARADMNRIALQTTLTSEP